MSVTPSISPTPVSESNDRLSPCSVSSISVKKLGHVSFACVFDTKSSVVPVLVHESLCELSVSPVSLK